jgi:hypothetical protein
MDLETLQQYVNLASAAESCCRYHTQQIPFIETISSDDCSIVSFGNQALTMGAWGYELVTLRLG